MRRAQHIDLGLFQGYILCISIIKDKDRYSEVLSNFYGILTIQNGQNFSDIHTEKGRNLSLAKEILT